MQRPCAHAESYARLVAGPSRNLTSVRALLVVRRTGRVAAKSRKILLNQAYASTSKYKWIKVNQTTKKIRQPPTARRPATRAFPERTGPRRGAEAAEME
jgi:hypothetical protein